MIPAFRFLLISILLFASVSASAQSESKVFITKTGAKYHRATCRYAQIGDQYLQIYHCSIALSSRRGRGEVEEAPLQPKRVPGVPEKHQEEVVIAGSMLG